jgi:uncharacterized protein YjdB
MTKALVIRWFLAAAVLSMAAYGGGGRFDVAQASALGKLRVGVTWAEPSRLVPIASNSIKVQVFDGATEVASAVIPKPLTIKTFDELPTGNLTVVASAYPETDGSGVAQATGSVPATITAGTITTVNLTMATTITHVDVTPVTSSLSAGQTTTLVATPKDANNNVVLVSPLNIVWSSSNPLVAAVVPATGLVTALLMGDATITATEVESGVSGAADVNVSVAVSILPSSVTVSIFGIQLFVATVVGSANIGVTWSVVEGAAGGSINALGLYTAPISPGTYHVKATSNADPTRSATATVTVNSGGLIVNVN